MTGLQSEALPRTVFRRPTAAVAWLSTTVLLTIAAFAAAVTLAPPASTRPPVPLTCLLFLGSSVHVASTASLYTMREVRAYAGSRKARYVWAPICLVLALSAAAATITPSAFAWLLLPYFAWQFFHFQKQNLGIASLTASSLLVTSLRGTERRLLVAAGTAGIAGLVAHPALLGLRIATHAAWLFPLAGFAFGSAVLMGAGVLLRRPRLDRPAGFCVAYLGSLLFFTPVFVFASPYAAVAGMTIAHGFQYLVLVGVVVGGVTGGRARRVALLTFVNISLTLGVGLSVVSHLHSGAPAVRLLFGAYLGVVMSHFVVDAGLWRLRDSFPRAFVAARAPYLVAPAARAAPAAPDAPD